MEEYVGRTSLYAQRTSRIACTLSIKLSTPHVLRQVGFARWALFWAIFGLVVWGPVGPSSFGLITILRRPAMGFGPFWKIGLWIGPGVVFGIWSLWIIRFEPKSWS